ncbi:aldehyde-activating protein [Legionella antarctica]|uniref:Aldehyde-activating protein n=1 Tax=Legionella antarctica TaxID=2708020 RepID=A0A6F8T769_9GAMM|nr:GFA family protein [Legionella antarctica]BCA96258.1 aldehyde-activating protein [Legionella antarctica]
MAEFDGGCLCNATTYMAKGEPHNPHLCSCTMCQKNSGAPTVAWVEFPLKSFEWTGSNPALYQSSELTQRCFCQNCGGLLATFNRGYSNICITIASLNKPNQIIPSEQHSYKYCAPKWWKTQIIKHSSFS